MWVLTILLLLIVVLLVVVLTFVVLLTVVLIVKLLLVLLLILVASGRALFLSANVLVLVVKRSGVGAVLAVVEHVELFVIEYMKYV